ncbi:MAG: transposase domain-containing protein [Deltaproteobacteria bacterium]|nr:transposase domain-containing protein [Deltaproteobacteria bacterium]
MVTTCVLHGVDPYRYLVDVLQRVRPIRSATSPISRRVSGRRRRSRGRRSLHPRSRAEIRSGARRRSTTAYL